MVTAISITQQITVSALELRLHNIMFFIVIVMQICNSNVAFKQKLYLCYFNF